MLPTEYDQTLRLLSSTPEAFANGIADLIKSYMAQEETKDPMDGISIAYKGFMNTGPGTGDTTDSIIRNYLQE